MLDKIEEYYSDKLRTHGAVPAGVDWNSLESQKLRYSQLLKCADRPFSGSLLDYGCGYGALLEIMKKEIEGLEYYGFDISMEMIEAARKKFGTQDNVHWMHEVENQQFDYLVASGLFNVRLEESDSNWLDYIHDSIMKFDKLTKKSFSFNVLTSYSDKPKMRDYLYYASPEDLFAFCKKNISRNVGLLHDYDLYEFTIIVRK